MPTIKIPSSDMLAYLRLSPGFGHAIDPNGSESPTGWLLRTLLLEKRVCSSFVLGNPRSPADLYENFKFPVAIRELVKGAQTPVKVEDTQSTVQQHCSAEALLSLKAYAKPRLSNINKETKTSIPTRD